MRLPTVTAAVAGLACSWPVLAVVLDPSTHLALKITPKVVIVSMFDAEADVWPDRIARAGLGNLRKSAIRVPGLSPLYPSVLCVRDHSICQVTVGMGEINAAASTMAFITSPRFDLTAAYFVLAGIAGVNPKHGTLGTVALARYAVQVALQHEIDAREMPPGFPTGYLAYGTSSPDQYPSITYGTEVMELNVVLRDLAHEMAAGASLQDSDAARGHRAKFAPERETYATAIGPPGVVKCDSVTSDVYYTGNLLSEAFENTTTTWTNGTGVYCMTAQEDNAVLGVLVRGAVEGLLDFDRTILMRTGSNFDRPPPNMTAYEHLVAYNQNGFDIAIANIGIAGVEIVKGIVDAWDCTFSGGIRPTNYVGDILGSLRGHPDFGPGSMTAGKGFAALRQAPPPSEEGVERAAAAGGRRRRRRGGRFGSGSGSDPQRDVV